MASEEGVQQFSNAIPKVSVWTLPGQTYSELVPWEEGSPDWTRQKSRIDLDLDFQRLRDYHYRMVSG